MGDVTSQVLMSLLSGRAHTSYQWSATEGATCDGDAVNLNKALMRIVPDRRGVHSPAMRFGIAE